MAALQSEGGDIHLRSGFPLASHPGNVWGVPYCDSVICIVKM
jgi:hypothetical protein